MFDWENFERLSSYFLNECISNIKENCEESLYRAIIILSYYSIFKPIEDHLKSKLNLDKISHQKVVEMLKKQNNSYLKQVGYLLYDLKGRRELANYDTAYKCIKKEAEDALQDAKTARQLWKQSFLFLNISL